ncbi:MAG: threonine--tRNA ligase [Patescibacteria group bacterium]|nr:threonine--tRNA ligase [Patescibacteria group bacterium]
MAKQARKTKNDKHSKLSTLRHSASHTLAAAVLDMCPGSKLGVGPATEDGFYYDFDLPNPISPEDLPKLEKKIRGIIARDLDISKSELPIDAAIEKARNESQDYKIELIQDLKAEGKTKVSYYTIGDFTDLCEGPHVNSTKDIGVVKLLSIAGAYWRGDENKPQLTRIYGTAFETQEKLDEYLKRLEEAKKRDHRLLGEQLDLFSFQPEGPGFVFWHPKGKFITKQVIQYMRQVLAKNNYQEVETPIILNEELWHKSGHWDNYKENMYFTSVDERNYAIKPMNCPGSVLIFKDSLHSYRDLPLRMAEFGLVHRHELSGVLHGLFRVRSFVQDDAHSFCTPEQIKDEIKNLLDTLKEVYKTFGFTKYKIELSTRPEKAIGSDELWEKSEKIMEEVAKEQKLKLSINEGAGAFYGPKFDFHIEDAIGRTWQLGTIQLDFSMPERLGATYIDSNGDKQNPVLIHRAILGSLERFIGILIEHYGGRMPLWLAPIQAIILSIGQDHIEYANQVSKSLEKAKLRVEVDDRNETLGKKIREAELKKVPYIVVIGDKEKENNSVAIRTVATNEQSTLSLEDGVKLIKKFKNPIKR